MMAQRSLLLLMLCLAVPACGQHTSTELIDEPCVSDSDCQKGQACVVLNDPSPGDTALSSGSVAEGDKTCQIPCRSDVECPDGYTCSATGDEAGGYCRPADESR